MTKIESIRHSLHSICIVIIVFVFASCAGTNKYDNIHVGMTWDEYTKRYGGVALTKGPMVDFNGKTANYYIEIEDDNGEVVKELWLNNNHVIVGIVELNH